MNAQETSRLLSVIKAEYQHKFVIDRMTAGVWMELLNAEPAIPYQAAHQAAIAWMKHNDWPPSVKNLRDTIAETVLGIPNADEAWNHLQRWLRAGYPGMPDNRPPLPSLTAQACRDIGGTSMIRNSEKPEAIRQRFTERYNRLRREHVDTADVGEAWTALGAGNLVALPRKGVA